MRKKRLNMLFRLVGCLVVYGTVMLAQESVPTGNSGQQYFLTAEQAHYPVPSKVLSLKEPLGLTSVQIKKINELIQNLSVVDQIKSQDIAEAEADLNKLFSTGNINDKSLRLKIEKIGKLQAELRFSYLQVCVKVKQLLTANQNDRYKELVAGEGK